MNTHSLSPVKIFLTVFTLSLGVAVADVLPLSSRISDVTVYLDRARITRAGDITLPPGESVVRFAGLPATMDESSVQAKGQSNGDVKILGLEIRDKYSDRTINDAVRKLQEESQVVENQMAKLDDEHRDLLERRDFLLKLKENMVRDLGKEVKSNQVSAAQLKETYGFYSAEIKVITDRVRAIDWEKRSVQPKMQKISEEISRLQAGQSRVEKEILVSVRSDKGGDVSLQIDYVMPGASWKPVYDARARINSSQVDLTYYGVVQQQTGENWNDVKLSLSTARPNVGGRMQELNPWWLEFQGVMPMSSPSMSKAQAMLDMSRLKDNRRDQVFGMGNSLALNGEAQPQEVKQETATLENRGVAMIFRVKTPCTIPSDGEPHKSTISTTGFKGKLEYASTPKLLEAAFLKARLSNHTEAPILGGEVNLFLEDDFVGKSYVNFISPSADFDFYLGVDDGIKVTRKQLSDHRDESGIFTKSKDLVRKFEMVIVNFKSSPQTVTVYDQIPVSQNGDIQVNGVKFSEKPKDQNKETGKVAWEMTLKPKEKKVITLEFQVQWPQGKELAGL